MATIVGWFRHRPTPKRTRTVEYLSSGWTRGEDGKGRLTISAHTDIDREHLRIELSYDEARGVIKRLEDYMRRHPEEA